MKRAAGYEALVDRYRLDVIPNWHRSFVWSEKQVHKIEKEADGMITETFPAKQFPGEGTGEQLEFALKYDGVNLTILTQIFEALDREEFLAYLRSKPTGKYARRLWYLYEYLTGKRLPLKDLKQGNYVDLLEPDRYVVVDRPDSVKRQRVRDNLPGVPHFCPIVRKSETVRKLYSEDLAERCRKVIEKYSEKLLSRALSYLYTKETKSSFAIEREEPGSTRTERYVRLLEEAEKEDFCAKEKLVELQNRIVDPRFADDDYRQSQNYVGESVLPGREKVHYISPKPEDLPGLMEGLLAAHRRMKERGVHPVVHAAVIAYGFVFLHPFEDGNGRIHRFLIHNILALDGFTPKGIMFPVSAAMLDDVRAYDTSLELFSKPLVEKIDYTLDEEGTMNVYGDTAVWYRCIDMTPQVEALYRFVLKTIEKELPRELAYLEGYDRAKAALREIVDMPDRKIDLFIRFVLQNGGRISQSKRKSHFAFLSEEEIVRMQKAVAEAFDAVKENNGGV